MEFAPATRSLFDNRIEQRVEGEEGGAERRVMLEFAARIWGARFGTVRAQFIEACRWQRLRLGRSLALPAEFTLHREGSRFSDTEFVRQSN
jgi:hypothetical protein